MELCDLVLGQAEGPWVLGVFEHDHCAVTDVWGCYWLVGQYAGAGAQCYGAVDPLVGDGLGEGE